MEGVREATRELQEGSLAREGLVIRQVYDETEYIVQSIATLRNNLLLGITLAVGILWWFLRRLPGDRCHRFGDPDLAVLLVLRAQPGRANAQRGFPGCAGIRHGTGAGRLHRRAGEHRPVAGKRRAKFRRIVEGPATGLGRLAGVDRNDSGDLPADPVSAGLLRAALCGSGVCHFGGDHRVAVHCDRSGSDGRSQLAAARQSA